MELTLIANIQDLLEFFDKKDIVEIIKENDLTGLGSLNLKIKKGNLYCKNKLSQKKLDAMDSNLWEIKEYLLHPSTIFI